MLSILSVIQCISGGRCPARIRRPMALAGICHRQVLSLHNSRCLGRVRYPAKASTSTRRSALDAMAVVEDHLSFGCAYQEADGFSRDMSSTSAVLAQRLVSCVPSWRTQLPFNLSRRSFIAAFNSDSRKLTVMSPRVRSSTPRTMSVLRRSPPVMASGKSIVTSTS